MAIIYIIICYNPEPNTLSLYFQKTLRQFPNQHQCQYCLEQQWHPERLLVLGKGVLQVPHSVQILAQRLAYTIIY